MSHFVQNKMKKKMSHLVLVTEVTVSDPEVGGSEAEQDAEEHRPLLGTEETGCSTSTSQREDARVTTNHSLVPDAALPAQVRSYDAVRNLKNAV